MLEKKSPHIRRAKHDKENPYVIISNKIFRDPDLSLKGKGLLGYLLTLPDTWEAHLQQVGETLKISKDTCQKLFKELINLGYCQKIQVKEKGKFSKVIYEFSEERIFKKSLPKQDFQAPEKPYVISNKTLKNIKTAAEKEKSAAAVFDFLLPLSIPQKEKEKLSLLPEDQVRKAVAFVSQPGFIPKKSLLAALRWALSESDVQDAVEVKPTSKLLKNVDKLNISIGSYGGGVYVKIKNEHVHYPCGIHKGKVIEEKIKIIQANEIEGLTKILEGVEHYLLCILNP